MKNSMQHSLVPKNIYYNLDAHRSNPANLFAGAFGMSINNTIFLIGIWGMLFAGKTANKELIPYCVALYSIITASFGACNFFFGGLRMLGEYITEGALEPMLATPRNPLLLVALSKSSPVALGDFLMGLIGLVSLSIVYDPLFAIRCSIATLFSIVGFASLFILAGSISFFVDRGSAVGQLVIEMSLSLSIYPTGKMMSGIGRILLLMTPAAAIAILPLDFVENAGAFDFITAGMVVFCFFSASVWFFRLGLKKYRAVSVIGAQG